MKEQQAPANDPSLLSRFISTVLGLLFTLLLSLFFSIMLEWVGMHLWWQAGHAEIVYRTELGYVFSGLQAGYVDRDQLHFMQQVNTWGQQMAQTLRLDHWRHWLYTQKSVMQFLSQGALQVEPYMEAATFTSKTFLLRLSVLFLSWPAFVMALLVGATDGFVERDLRRFGGGRESASLYLIGKSSIGPLFLGAWMVYLSVPVSVHPNMIILPFVLSFGLAIKVACERMKKYF